MRVRLSGPGTLGAPGAWHQFRANACHPPPEGVSLASAMGPPVSGACCLWSTYPTRSSGLLNLLRPRNWPVFSLLYRTCRTQQAAHVPFPGNSGEPCGPISAGQGKLPPSTMHMPACP